MSQTSSLDGSMLTYGTVSISGILSKTRNDHVVTVYRYIDPRQQDRYLIAIPSQCQ